jgi:hypothetical protein
MYKPLSKIPLLLLAVSYLYLPTGCNFSSEEPIILDSIDYKHKKLPVLNIKSTKDSSFIGLWYAKEHAYDKFNFFYSKNNKFFKEKCYCFVVDSVGLYDTLITPIKYYHTSRHSISELGYIKEKLAFVWLWKGQIGALDTFKILSNEDILYDYSDCVGCGDVKRIMTRVENIRKVFENRKEYETKCKNLDTSTIARFEYAKSWGIRRIYKVDNEYYQDFYNKKEITASAKLNYKRASNGVLIFKDPETISFGTLGTHYFNPKNNALFTVGEYQGKPDTIVNTRIDNWNYSYSRIDSAIYYGNYDYYQQQFRFRKKKSKTKVVWPSGTGRFEKTIIGELEDQFN